jgi:hypothetical protein
LQLRFADSDSQKRLKTTIAVPRRQAMESNVIYDHIPTTPLHIDAASCSSAAYQPEHEDQKSTKSGPSPPYSSAVDSLASGMANAQIK